jgi:hypothetical protein
LSEKPKQNEKARQNEKLFMACSNVTQPLLYQGHVLEG